MKLSCPILFCTPVFGSQSAANKTMPAGVPEFNVSMAALLPPVNLTEGMYDISIGETGRKEGYFVDIRYKWKRIMPWSLGPLGGGAAGLAVILGLFDVASDFSAGVVVLSSLAFILSIPLAITALVSGSIFAKDSVVLNKKKNREWQLTPTNNSTPGTFTLANIRHNGNPRDLDDKLLGLHKRLRKGSSAWTLQAREVYAPLVTLQPGEKIVVLQYIDLTSTYEPQWLAIKGSSRLSLSEQKVTAFKFSPASLRSFNDN